MNWSEKRIINLTLGPEPKSFSPDTGLTTVGIEPSVDHNGPAELASGTSKLARRPTSSDSQVKTTMLPMLESPVLPAHEPSIRMSIILSRKRNTASWPWNLILENEG